MSVDIFRYTKKDEKWWDEYVWQADNGNLFHTRKFLSYHPKDRFKDHSLILKKKNSIKAILPAVELIMGKEKVLFSHRGASYGGIVYKNLGISNAFDYVKALKSYASEHKFDKIIITHAPVIYMEKYSNYLDFAMLEQGFHYTRREISSIIQLPGASVDPLRLFKPEARTATRKSAKQNVEVRICDDFDDYYKILKKNLKLRHDVTPTHSLDELKKLVELFPDRIKLWGAYLQDKMIAGVVNFKVMEEVILAFYISDNKDFQEFRSLNLLFYEIFKWCQLENIRFYDFGIFTVNMDPNWGLAKFKEGFGARGLFRDTFECLL